MTIGESYHNKYSCTWWHNIPKQPFDSWLTRTSDPSLFPKTAGYLSKSVIL